ncbi:hypothetical protein HOLleu_34104 [Holothuria leucospilota]|uniref:Uncharacterized protein n=1 Tax=Holothuria leucospilota TaxID=206669 RepID=A0A9Q1BHL4_HOLLE|nr:hypothetical protein HOLleu_34104 [Holothuria leucospilota]
MTSVVLVQGASRGLGLQFCRNLLQRPSTSVVATCRAPEDATHLQQLEASNKDRLEILKLDVTQEDAIRDAAKLVKEKFKNLDLVINCAGMLHPSGKGETSLRDVSTQGLNTTFLTNAFGPLLVAKYFSPMLAAGSGSFGIQSENAKERHSGILVNMSARVGSITDNGFGGWYSYRMSKSALNMATKNLSIELGRPRNKIICVALHPGSVDTDLTRPYQRNIPKDKLFSTTYSVECLMKIISNLRIEDTGKYLAWNGKEIPF